MPTSPLVAPDQDAIDAWDIRERGIRGGDSSPSENFEMDSTSATRVVRCLWGSRHDVAQWFLGRSIVFDDSGTLRLSRLLPQVHPTLPGLIATKIVRTRGHKFVGWADGTMGTDEYQFTPSQLNVYQDAEMEILYEAAPFELETDAVVHADPIGELLRYVSQDQTEASGEYLALPGSVFCWLRPGGAVPHNISIPAAPGKIIPQEVFYVTLHRLPDEAFQPDGILFDRFYGVSGGDIPFLGTLNDHDFFGRPAGTVLSTGLRPKRRRSPLGDGYEWDLTWEFTYKPNGHNWAFYFDRVTVANSGYYFVGPSGGAYRSDAALIAAGIDDYSIYNYRDLTKLFSVAV